VRVYAGSVGGEHALGELRHHGLGRLVSPWSWKKPLQDIPWCFDNGAFRAWKLGIPWDADRFCKYAIYDDELEMPRIYHQAWAIRGPDFGVCPDKPLNEDSLEHSLCWIERLPAETPWYLAVQNGMSVGEVEEALDWASEEATLFWGIFVGGDARFKRRTVGAWVRLAHGRDLKVHVGRVSGLKALAWFELAGVDSVDSSAFETFVPASRVTRARVNARAQTRLAIA
jgi:hypothetical protein